MLRAVSTSGAAIEQLDQVSTRRSAALVQLGQAMLICQVADRGPNDELGFLRGAEARLVVRRLASPGVDDPIAYGPKVAVDMLPRSTNNKSSDSH